jgi:hypothetical protein
MALGLTTAGVQVGAAAIAADITKLRLHTGATADGTTFTTTAADKTVACTATGGVVTVPSTAFTGGAANGPCTHVSVWSGTTYRGTYALTGDTTFNAAGEYTVTGITITGSAT